MVEGLRLSTDLALSVEAIGVGDHSRLLSPLDQAQLLLDVLGVLGAIEGVSMMPDLHHQVVSRSLAEPADRLRCTLRRISTRALSPAGRQ